MQKENILDKEKSIINYIKTLWFDDKSIKNKSLLLQAFVHKSFAADFKKIQEHNERLEFLWDSILWLAIAKILFTDHPEMDEAKMTLYKIALVREENLAQVSRNIRLDQQILISRGEEKMQWRKKDAILSDSLEALIWYIFIDFWYNKVENFVREHVYSMYNKIEKNPIQSYKTMVQEILQKKHKETPLYKDFEHKIDEKWNVLLYKSQLRALWKRKSDWFWTNKKKAQEDAAKNFYKKI